MLDRWLLLRSPCHLVCRKSIVLFRPEFFHYLIYKPSYCNFPESRKKIKLISKIIFLFYPPTLNIICFVEKKIFLRFCLSIFESDTVKSDCPVQIFRKMMKYKDLIQTVGLP